MTVNQDAGPDEPAAGGPDVGSVAEEAAKLFGALGEWARDSAGDAEAAFGPDGPGGPGGLGAGLGAGLGGLAGHAARATSGIGEHVATGAAECTYCPICRAVHAVRSTSPEVREHLASAASSLLLALNGLVAGRPHSGPDSPTDEQFERIDLDGDDD